MFKTVLLSMLVACTMAQGMGHGISKSTWGSSDPLKCGKFIEKYIPAATIAQSECKDNHTCECATQGRYQLAHGQDSFGIHTINCTHHPYGEHSLADVEDMIHLEWGNFTEYHPFMDYNLQLYSSELDGHLENFEKGGVPFTALKWNSDNNKEYYSVLVNVCGYVVIEFIAPSVKDTSKFTQFDQVRFSFASSNAAPEPNHQHPNLATPIGISRASSKMEELVAFYDESIGIKQLKNFTYDDGTKHLVYMWDYPSNGIQINFWIDRPTSDDAKFTPKMFESYMRSVHDDVMVSDVCGFDQWMDNHYAYDKGPGSGGQRTYLDLYTEHAKKLGLQYHWWQTPGMTQVYIVDPTGFGIQFDGPAKNPPANVPKYTAACKSDDGCAGQGFCKSKDIFFLTD